jgi:hypothetical protein
VSRIQQQPQHLECLPGFEILDNGLIPCGNLLFAGKCVSVSVGCVSVACMHLAMLGADSYPGKSTSATDNGGRLTRESAAGSTNNRDRTNSCLGFMVNSNQLMVCVRPGLGDTRTPPLAVMELINDDLPTFERPVDTAIHPTNQPTTCQCTNESTRTCSSGVHTHHRTNKCNLWQLWQNPLSGLGISFAGDCPRCLIDIGWKRRSRHSSCIEPWWL